MTVLKTFISFALVILLAVSMSAQALDSPEIQCVSVNTSGNVTISWSVPADPSNEFTAYVLYSSTDGTNFNIVSSIGNPATTSFVHVGAGADAGSICYYMVTESNDGAPQTSLPSDTFCTLYLTVEQSTPEGFAMLEWEALNYPTGNYSFDVFVEFPTGIWSLLVNLPQGIDSYAHEVSTCGEFLNFIVSINNGNACQFQSNIAGDFFNDTTAPEIPTVMAVDVDSLSGNAVISWEASLAGDTDGYIIYQCVGGFTLILDTLWGQFNTVYENLASTAGAVGPEAYTVASFDTCLVGNPPSPNTSPTSSSCNTSMFLTGSWFPCDTDVDLIWTPYLGWTNGVSFYEVYVQENGNAPLLLGIVDGPGQTFTHQNINPGSSYRYFVKAFASGGGYDAISSTFTLNINQFQEPSFVYLSSASVVDDSTVEVRVFTESVPDAFIYTLQRKDFFSGDWDEVVSATAANVTLLEFEDPSVSTDVRSYEYRIFVENNCGDSVTVSNLGRTILAQGLANPNRLVNTLTWSAYGDWDGGVSEYRIYRSITDAEANTLIATVNSSTLFYEDDVIDYLLTKGEFCYTIEAVENPNFLGITETSLSNEVCVSQDPKIWIPNAFVVNGVNNEFFPVISFADFDNYLMLIYDRWGTVIFETRDIEEGWNGEVNGKLVQEGQYMYFISVVDGYGNYYERKGGLVMLVGAE